MSDISTTLHSASRLFGQCAGVVDGSATPRSALEYERLMGFGIATDWLTWGRHIQSLQYADKKRGDSERAHSLTELTRFTFAWTAANALFSRDEVLVLLDPAAPTRRSELDRFRVLYEHSGVSAADVNGIVTKLHKLLQLQMKVQHFPWPSVNTPPTILEVIYFKHTVPKEQTRGLGKKILHAITTGNYADLDLPTLIYATRNWNIHGVLLSSSFRGTRKKFNLWIDSINIALARVLEGSGKALRAAL